MLVAYITAFLSMGCRLFVGVGGSTTVQEGTSSRNPNLHSYFWKKVKLTGKSYQNPLPLVMLTPTGPRACLLPSFHHHPGPFPVIPLSCPSHPLPEPSVTITSLRTFIASAPHTQWPLGKNVPHSLSLWFHRSEAFIPQLVFLIPAHNKIVTDQ